MPDSDPPPQPRARRARRQPPLPGLNQARAPAPFLFHLCVTFDQVNGLAEFAWTAHGSKEPAVVGQVHCTGPDQLTWDLQIEGRHEAALSSHHREAIRAAMKRWLDQMPTRGDTFSAFWIEIPPGTHKPVRTRERFGRNEAVYPWLEDNIVVMAEALRLRFFPLGRRVDDTFPVAFGEFETYQRRLARKEQRREDIRNAFGSLFPS